MGKLKAGQVRKSLETLALNRNESEELAMRKSNMKMLNLCAAKVKQGDGLSLRKDEKSI